MLRIETAKLWILCGKQKGESKINNITSEAFDI